MSDHHRYASQPSPVSRRPASATHTSHAAHDLADACCRSCAISRRASRGETDDAAFTPMPIGRGLMILACVVGMTLGTCWAIWQAGRTAGAW